MIDVTPAPSLTCPPAATTSAENDRQTPTKSVIAVFRGVQPGHARGVRLDLTDLRRVRAQSGDLVLGGSFADPFQRRPFAVVDGHHELAAFLERQLLGLAVLLSQGELAPNSSSSSDPGA